MAGTRITTGIREVDAKLQQLARRDANKIARASVNAGLTELTREIRRSIDAQDISSRMKRAMKRTVGKRFVTGGKRAKFGVSAKAGLGVGSRNKGARGTKNRKGMKGVGLSGNNVHWAALGTNPRYTGSLKRRGRTRLTGNRRRYTGEMPSIPVVREAGKNGISSLRRVMEAKARAKIEELL